MLFLCDTVFGYLLAAVLFSHQEDILGLINSRLSFFFYEYFQSMIIWLMGWPAGFKLNNPLDRFLGDMFLWMLRVWRSTSEDSGTVLL